MTLLVAIAIMTIIRIKEEPVNVNNIWEEDWVAGNE